MMGKIQTGLQIPVRVRINSRQEQPRAQGDRSTWEGKETLQRLRQGKRRRDGAAIRHGKGDADLGDLDFAMILQMISKSDCPFTIVWGPC